MQNLNIALRRHLEVAKRILFLGVGSDMRGDDAFGPSVAATLKNRLQRADLSERSILIIDGGSAPENMTGDIRRFKPTHLVLLDAADMSMEPGAIGVYSSSEIVGMSFSTHRLPLSMLVEYLRQDCQFEAILVAVQPATLSFGAPISEAVKTAITNTADAIEEAIMPAGQKRPQIES